MKRVAALSAATRFMGFRPKYKKIKNRGAKRRDFLFSYICTTNFRLR